MLTKIFSNFSDAKMLTKIFSSRNPKC